MDRDLYGNLLNGLPKMLDFGESGRTSTAAPLPAMFGPPRPKVIDEGPVPSSSALPWQAGAHQHAMPNYGPVSGDIPMEATMQGNMHDPRPLRQQIGTSLTSLWSPSAAPYMGTDLRRVPGLGSTPLATAGQPRLQFDASPFQRQQLGAGMRWRFNF